MTNDQTAYRRICKGRRDLKWLFPEPFQCFILFVGFTKIDHLIIFKSICDYILINNRLQIFNRKNVSYLRTLTSLIFIGSLCQFECFACGSR